MGRAKLKSLKDNETIELDVVREENPAFDTDASDHPIEDGASVSDHITLRPINVTMDGVVAGEGAANKIATLRRWRNERHRLKFTGRNIFKNYVISEFSSEHDVTVRDGFRFRLVLQQVRIVKPALVEIISPDPVKADPTPTPEPPPPEADPPEDGEDEGTNNKDLEDRGRQQRDTSGHPALGERADWKGHPALGAAEPEANRYAGHPAKG